MIYRLLMVLMLLATTVISNAQHCIPFIAEQKETVLYNIQDIQGVWISDTRLVSNVHVFNEYLWKLGEKKMTILTNKKNALLLQYDKKAKPESYTIHVDTALHSIVIAGGESGIFYGLMTLLQWKYFYRVEAFEQINTLYDYPAFSWRGMHLDVSRHFFDIAFIKKYIDMLAIHKLNVFHWHLTDDQGWRIEIKKYPLLTQIGCTRKETIVEKNFMPFVGDGKPVSGYYTQEQIKEIVKYASDRHITVVPEIEMPGHAMAALAAYPEYSCTGIKEEVMKTWGVSEHVFCTKDSTIRFLKDILDEVLKLFPSKYIHIGGDEVPKERWKVCNKCQDNIKKYKLKDEHELQSYFITQIDKYLSAKGRNTIGWDEILEGGLAPGAAVMSWRGIAGGVEAARQKHSVVMSPGTHCYFDHYQAYPLHEPLAIGGYTPIEKVYEFNPIPKQLTAQEIPYIMGAQANVWTEYMKTSEHVEYMVFPRLCALSEVLWTGNLRPGFDDFKYRLRKHFIFLDEWNVHYAKTLYDISQEAVPNEESLEVVFKSNFNNGGIIYNIHYADGETLIQNTESEGKFKLLKSGEISAYYSELNEIPGRSTSYKYSVHKALGKPTSSTPEPSSYYNSGGTASLVNGISGRSPRVNTEWLAWHENDVTIMIDLEEEKLLSSVSLGLLEEKNAHIYLPQKICILIGNEDNSYIVAKTMDAEEISKMYQKDIPLMLLFDNFFMGRFVKCIMEYDRKAEHKPWLFLSEIEVD